MQMIRKNRWVIVASLAFAIIFGGVFIAGNKPVYADLYGSIVKDCHYQFVGSNQNTIERSACPNGYADITFNLLDAGKHTYSEKSKVLGCTQFIDVSGSDLGSTAPITGTLYGKYEPKGELACGDVNFGDSTTEIQIYSAGSAGGDATDDEIKSAAYQVAVYDKLEDLIHKRCKDDSSGYCTKQMVSAVNTCTTETMNSIKDSDSNKNDKFKALFSRCFTTKVHSYNDGSSADITRDKVYAALGDNIYTEVKAAGEAALTKSSNGGDPDSCSVSSSPASWIICPIYDGIASLSDSLLNNAIVPMLKTNPVSTDPDSVIYKVWSSFRVWGDIMLIIGLIVIVFGQAIGGGMLDPYTAKKALPRLLVAAILVNLSLYLVAFAVDISNIVGQSVGNIITAPLDGVSLSPDGWKLGITAALAALGGVGVSIVGGGMFLMALAVGSIMDFIPFLLLFVILPAFLAIAMVFITLALRQAIIMALILVSPVAFALYCLPNTEQYFKKWWDLLFNMLLIYPIVIVIFAVADLLAYTTLMSMGTDSIWGYILAFLLQFVPLLMIPFAFKLAGGVLGRIHDIASGFGKRGVEAIKGDPRDPLSMRNIAKDKARGSAIRGKAQFYRSASQRLDSSSKLAPNGSRRRVGAAKALSYMGASAIEREALLTAEGQKRMFAVKDSGDDRLINARSSFVDTDGIRKTLDGKPVSESDWQASKHFYPNLAGIQASAEYRSTKVLPQEQAEAFTRNFGIMAKQQGLTPNEATGIITGTSFARQNERGEWKHGKFVEDKDTGEYVFKPVGTDGAGNDDFIQEQYYKRGSFEGSRMFSSYFNSMADLKKMHLDNYNTLSAKSDLGDDDKKALTNSKLRLKQIREIEKAFDIGSDTVSQGEGGDDRRVSPYNREGLSGASAGTSAAFDKLKKLGKETTVMKTIEEEIGKGQTYEVYEAGLREHQNTADPGAPYSVADPPREARIASQPQSNPPSQPPQQPKKTPNDPRSGGDQMGGRGYM